MRHLILASLIALPACVLDDDVSFATERYRVTTDCTNDSAFFGPRTRTVTR